MSSVRKSAARGGRALVRKLPPTARTRIREVKRAALGQPPVPRPKPAAPPAARPAAAAAPAAPVSGPRPSIPGVTRLELRRQSIFATVPRDADILEIGPAHNAILPKREGFHTRTVDYLDRAGLVEKYKDFSQYKPEDIEEVDFVLPPGAAMGDIIDDRFDVVVASHVLEHTTSLVDFVVECARLLKPGGALALVVPDSRFCFDRFRERTGISSVIDASVEPKGVHTVGTLTEFGLYAVRHRAQTSWAPGHRGKYTFVHDLDEVRAKQAAASSGSYVDVHHWVFTPHHLRLMLHDLADLGYVPLREAHFHDTVGHEFFLNLTAESAGSGLDRSELMTLAAEELRTADALTWGPEEAG